MTKKIKPRNYCSNEQFIQELKKYHKTGIMSNELGLILMKIANKLTGHSYFRGYDQYTKDELVGCATLRMVSQIDMFDVNRSTYLCENNDTNSVEYVTINLKENEITTINGSVYKRIKYKLINVDNELDVIKLTKPNPFAYFTQMAWNSFVRECTNHYKQKNIKRKLAISQMDTYENNDHIKLDKTLYNNIQEMINDDDHYVTQKKKRLDTLKKENDEK